MKCRWFTIIMLLFQMWFSRNIVAKYCLIIFLVNYLLIETFWLIRLNQKQRPADYEVKFGSYKLTIWARARIKITHRWMLIFSPHVNVWVCIEHDDASRGYGASGSNNKGQGEESFTITWSPTTTLLLVTSLKQWREGTDQIFCLGSTMAYVLIL